MPETDATHADAPEVLDVLGVGFGPSNLALAIALREAAREPGRGLRALFCERQPSFGWHRGMLLEGATMQVSFLKDLVTMRNPASDFSFLSYLNARERLVDFINHKTLFPLRIEFHDYFEWAAERLRDVVQYGSEVMALRPVRFGSEVTAFDVVSRESGGLVQRRARNVVLACGLRPRLPQGIVGSDRVWHNHELLPRAQELQRRSAGGRPPRRFVVLGAGQSAAETVEFLHRTFADAEVCSVFAKYGYSPADDSPYANRIFDPEAVDRYYQAPPEVKRRLMDYHRGTNYSVVDLDLIEQLYRVGYAEQVSGRRRLRMLNTSRVADVADRPGKSLLVDVEQLTTGEVERLECDALVCATGYAPIDPLDLLGEAGDLCERDEQQRLRVARDFRVVTRPEVTAGIYVQGSTEHSHGLTSTLLSTTAVRAGEIVDSLLCYSTAERTGTGSLSLAQ